MPFISMLPILQNNNNAILSDLKAMPLKDITSDGASSFTLGRMNYVRSYNSTQPNYIASNHVQKKWIGRNQDASTITAGRRINSIGNGTLNAAQDPMAFTNGTQVNVVRNAKERTRNQGSSVPAKVTQKGLKSGPF